jgi:hypothetical protein
MKLTYKKVLKVLGYANLGLGLLCILVWILNSLSWIRLGSPDGQLISAVACITLGTILLAEKAPNT